MSDASRRFGSLEDTASMLGLSYNQTRKLDLPIVRVGRRVLVDLDAVRARFASQASGALSINSSPRPAA